MPFTSSVGVAVSTLAAAALFNPLRGSIQRLVDRRFNPRTLRRPDDGGAFGSRLRDSVDDDTICGELLDAVDHALAPRYASIWIKPVGHPDRGP